MFCQKCGARNDDDAQFCKGCGSSFVPSGVATRRPVSKYSRIGWGIVGVMFLGFIILVVSLNGNNGTTEPSHQEGRMITYRVTCQCGENNSNTGYADVTYESANQTTTQESPISMPWTHQELFQSGSMAYISAQTDEYGSVKAEILIDGQPAKETESIGKGTIAQVSGLVP